MYSFLVRPQTATHKTLHAKLEAHLVKIGALSSYRSRHFEAFMFYTKCFLS
jgi:hypothetical protein